MGARIAIVTHKFPPVVGSAAAWNRELAELLGSLGYNVTVYHFQDRKYPPPEIRNVRVKALRVGKYRRVTGFRHTVYFLWHAMRISLQFLRILPSLARAELWQGSFGEEMYLKAYMSLWRFVFRKPLCLAVNSQLFAHEHTGWKAKMRECAMDLVLMSTNVIITAGEDLKLNILQEGLVGVPIHVLLPAVDCSELHPGVPTGAFYATLKERGLERPPRPRLGFLGELTEENAPGVFVEVIEHFPKCGALVIGDGPLKPDVRAALEPLGQRATLVGYTADSLLPSALASVDLCVFPFEKTRGGVPTPVLQAMACGKPVLAYDVGHLSGLITNGVDGILVPHGDCRRLQSEIRRMLDFPSLCEKMGEAAVRTVCKHWDLSRRRQEYAKFYSEFLEAWRISRTSPRRRKALEAAAMEKSGPPKGSSPP